MEIVVSSAEFKNIVDQQFKEGKITYWVKDGQKSRTDTTPAHLKNKRHIIVDDTTYVVNEE